MPRTAVLLMDLQIDFVADRGALMPGGLAVQAASVARGGRSPTKSPSGLTRRARLTGRL
jgi:hypothetical protein